MTRRIIGVDRATACRRVLSLNLVDDATDDLSAVADCEAVIVCTPVDVIARHIREAACLCRAGTLLTDVGSTKR